MGQDIERERLLLDEHIFEKGQERMAQLEGQMAAVQADFRASATAFDPLATLPGERATWDALQHDVAAIQAPVHQVLALSRENLDAEAYDAREQLNEPFAAIDREGSMLVTMNQQGANRTLSEMSALQHESAWFIGAMCAAGLVLTILVGAGVTRLVQSRESRLHWHSETLEVKNRDLDAFAGRVAHDLRGPLSTMGYAVALFEKRVPAEQGTVAIMHRAVGRMERLIDDLLALSRIEAPSETLPVIPPSPSPRCRRTSRPGFAATTPSGASTSTRLGSAARPGYSGRRSTTWPTTR